MQIKLADLNSTDVYFLMTQTIIPRPVAWVLTENADGISNLAPFSYFSGVSSRPPLLMLSIGKRPDGSDKDTRANIEAQQHFVVHIGSSSELEPLNASAAPLAAGESEVERLGLATVPFEGFALPRLACARVAMGCRLHQLIEVGDAPQALVLGRVETVYIDDGVTSRDAKGRLKVHADRLDPIARLGAREYALLGERRELARPKTI